MTHQTTGRHHKFATATAALAVSVATAAGALAATTAPAFADSTTTTTTVATIPAAGGATETMPPLPGSKRLNWVKRDSARLIANRVRSLNKAIRIVSTKSYLGSDAATLTTAMQSDVSGLKTLHTKIAGDATLQQALADRALIFTDYRVYVVALPVTNDVSNVDWLVNFKLPALQQQITQVQGQENSTNQGVLGPLVTGMQSMAQSVTSSTTGLDAELLAYTPAEWNANHNLLFSANAGVRTAAAAMAGAEKDYAAAERYLTRGKILPRHHKGHGLRPEPVAHKG